MSNLAPEAWHRIAAPGELTVREVLAHLAATDGLVAAALGLPVQPPVEPGEKVAARAPRPRCVRLHLTGPGGGTWTVPLDPAATVSAAVRPATVVTLDVIEFCRLAADRRDPGRLAVEVRGDTALARGFLAAVPAMAPVP